MRALGIASFGLAIAMAAASQAADDQGCNWYADHEQLPEGFDVIGEADIGSRHRLFIFTDGECTCNNIPAISRDLGKAVPKGINWQCRQAEAEERAFASEHGDHNR